MSHPGYEQILDPNEPDANLLETLERERSKRNRVIIVTLVTFSTVVLAVIGLALLKPPYDSPFGVSSSNAYATNHGYDILSRGGNVVDAMVAIQYVSCFSTLTS